MGTPRAVRFVGSVYFALLDANREKVGGYQKAGNYALPVSIRYVFDDDGNHTYEVQLAYEDRTDNEGVDDDSVFGSLISLGAVNYAEDLVVDFQADASGTTPLKAPTHRRIVCTRAAPAS